MITTHSINFLQARSFPITEHVSRETTTSLVLYTAMFMGTIQGTSEAALAPAGR